jgi:O-antigen/teichoic acid export membrane protein
VLATLATLIIAPFIGAWLGWNSETVFNAQLIAPLAFANANATPKGLLRLYGRFDLLTIHATVTPAARLCGIAVAAYVDASLTVYLALWLIAGLLGTVVVAQLALGEARRHGCLAGFDLSLAHLTRDNRGVWRFSVLSNLHSTMALIPGHFSTFLIGAILGPMAAGLFKVARELGTAFAKPVDLINQAVYPDIARLVVAQEWSRLRRTVLNAGTLAAAMSALVTLVILIAGGPVIVAIFGQGYEASLPVLILMSLSTAIAVAAFAVDPMMYAFGRPGASLITAIIANGVFVALLVWRIPLDGLIAAGWAYLGLGIATVVISGIWFLRTIPVPVTAVPAGQLR